MCNPPLCARPPSAVRSPSPLDQAEAAAAGGVPFVSSNDVATAWFLQQSGADLGASDTGHAAPLPPAKAHAAPVCPQV